MKDIQLILLCGGNSNLLSPLVNNPYVKHLVNILNKPLVSFPYEQLNKHFISNIIVICNSENKNKLERYFNSMKNNLNNIKNIIFFYDNECSNVMEYLIVMKQKNILNKDFVLYSGDLITNINLNELIDYHYKNDSNLTITFSNKNVTLSDRKFWSTIDENNNIYSLNFLAKIAEKGINFKPIVHQTISKLKCFGNLKFAHIFILSFELISIMEKTINFYNSFIEEFIPFIIYNKFNENFKHWIDTKNNEELFIEDYFKFNLNSEIKNLNIKSYITNDYFKRIDSIKDYIKVNIDSINILSKDWSSFDIKNYIGVQHKDYILGKDCKINEKVKIFKSVIGDNCLIEENCVINNCIIMKDSIIKKNCNLINTIICNKTIISQNCTLKNVIIDYNQFLKEKNKLEDEIIEKKQNDDIQFDGEQQIKRKFSNI